MKKYYSIMLTLLLVLTAAVPASFVGAQSNSQFSEIIQKISASENLSSQEKEAIMDEAIDLHYDEGVDLDSISEILDQNDNYNDIENQFINLEIDFDDDNDRDDDSDDDYDDDDEDMDDDHDDDDDRDGNDDNDDNDDDGDDDDDD